MNEEILDQAIKALAGEIVKAPHDKAQLEDLRKSLLTMVRMIVETQIYDKVA